MNTRGRIIKRLYASPWLQRLLFNPFVEYHQWRLRRFVLRAASSLCPGQRVIDVGAGELKYKMHFAHCEYISTDLCVGDGDWNYHGVDVVASAYALPVGSDSVDAVLCVQVLEHLDDPARAIAEFRRILKPGGRAYVSVPLLAGEHQQPFDFFRYTRYGLASLAKKAGLQVVSIESHGGSMIALETLAWAAFWGVLPLRRQTIARYVLYVLLYPLKLVTGAFAALLDMLDRGKAATINYDAVFERPLPGPP